MTVVEREKMEQVLEELGKSFSGMLDSSTAAEIGKMLGVEAIVVGTVADMGNSVDLRARLLDVEKGTAITAAQIDVVKDPTITKIISDGKRKAIYGKVISKSTKEGQEIIGEVLVDQLWKPDNNRWKTTLVSYQLFEDGLIQFNLLIENLQDKPYNCIFYSSDSSTYLLDNLSKQYFNPTTSVPEKGMQLIQKMPVKFSVSFSKFKEGVEAVVLYLKWLLYYNGTYDYYQMYFGPIELK